MDHLLPFAARQTGTANGHFASSPGADRKDPAKTGHRSWKHVNVDDLPRKPQVKEVHVRDRGSSEPGLNTLTVRAAA